MPTQRRASDYPPRFYNIFRETAKLRKLEIEMDSPEGAKAFRQRLYAFRSFLSKGRSDDAGVAVIAPALTMRVRENVLIIECNNEHIIELANRLETATDEIRTPEDTSKRISASDRRNDGEDLP